ncbi:ABC transporter ATP-binding protein [Acetobacterium woodii]|uniref:Sugar ABC transport system ATP-binding protein n=1 Tax=Acetobacterium woodii (strain ATCC 29683 / DSM 1030 / JCM 2381 / KCTC 1655 / WB1) TaxID=931626 RepID=H6LKA0_ACEWD|nr:ABC transporter ATP-binding protein [Acetobacterium woodii]AFA50020.1 sugar ABC transport system ATP-binding protein [Acetobacterium woodii DSM 1030]
MSNIELENITKCYPKGKKTAIDAVTIAIQDKEFIVLVGPSGSGKTTILRIIAGLTDMSSGSLFIDGKDASGVSPRNRGIGMVFQNYALYRQMTVYQNIAFGCCEGKGNKSELSEKIQETAVMLGIESYLNRKPGELSGGQRQRVAIARAIAREPRILLMDEPLSNLDVRLRDQMRIELRALRNRINTTCIYVTHDQEEAMILGDRIVVLNKGRVEQVGTAREIYEEPANLFVAGFMGNHPMNIFENGWFDKKNNRDEITIFGKTFNLPSRKQPGIDEENNISEEVFVGVRPEHIRICNIGDGQGIDGIVEFCEWLGSKTILHVKSGDQTVTIKTQMERDLRPESSISFCFDPEVMHIFYKNGKRRV